MILAVALVAAACGGADDPDDGNGGDTPPITGVAWELRSLSLDGADIDLAGTTPTIEFQLPDQAGGTNGCNSYGGSYSVSQGEIGFGAMFQTEIGCPPEIAAVESAFMTAIGRVDRFNVVDGSLTLFSADGSAHLEFAEPPPVLDNALQGSWILDTIGTAEAVSSIVAGTEPVLVVADASVSGSTGCNSFTASLRWDDDGTFVVGDLEVTEVACAPGIMAQERSVLEMLRDTTRYEIEGDRLLISTDTGDRFLRYTAAD